MASGTTTARSSPSSGLEEILLNSRAYIGKRSNATTAGDLTRNEERIEVSLCPAHPPLLSRLYVHCPNLVSSSFSETPRILCMVDGLILIRIAIRCREPRFILMEECDYFIYRVDLPSLKLLPHPHPACFQDDEVGLLPRGDQNTIAALVGTNNPTVFTLYLLHSEIGSWTSIAVSLDGPQKFPLEIPSKASQHFDYWINTVITLGGEGGTMGWVDLLHGILLCDVRSENINLRAVPLPVPLNDEMELGCPEPYRGLAYVNGKDCHLRFVDLEVRSTRLPGLDPETGKISMRFDDWTIRTWSNFNMTGSCDDWKMDYHAVTATKINSNKSVYRQLQGALKRDNRDIKLQNLCVSHPTPSVHSGNIVYLMTKAKFMDSKACVLAIDMKKRNVRDVVEVGTEREPGEDVICLPVSISKVLVNKAASQGDFEGAEESTAPRW